MLSVSYPRPLVLIGLLLGCTILAFYAGLLLHISIVYTHLFYIPIVLGGLWYPRKALLPALYLGIIYLGVEYALGSGLEISILARAGSFLVMAALVGLIAGRIQKGDRASLQYMSSYAERVSIPRTRILSTFDGVRMSLGMNMDVERMREQGDVAGLIRTLDHPNAGIRYQVADALGTLHNAAAGERLAQALKDPDCGVRWKAAEALGKLGESALPLLFRALHDPSPDVRWRAALALGDTGKVEVLPALVGALADPDRYVQGRAILGLAGFGEIARNSLTRAVQAEDPHAQAGAIRALGLQGDPGLLVIFSILQERPVDIMLLSPLEEAFYDLGARSIPPLKRFLENADPALRALACRVLGRLGDTKLLDTLIGVRDRDESESVRNDADIAVLRLEAIARRISK
jgi:hypothetical protein